MTKQQHFDPGYYKFAVNADDGSRLFIDGQNIMDNWGPHAGDLFETGVLLSGGTHELTFEYKDIAWGANFKAQMFQDDPWNPKWTVHYFNNINFEGPSIQDWVNCAPHQVMNEIWGGGSPHEGISNDNFSDRWEQTRLFRTGDYTFKFWADDGLKFYIDGQHVIDSINWPEGWYHEFSTHLNAGWHSLMAEHRDIYGGAQLVGELSNDDAPDWNGQYFNSQDLSGGVSGTNWIPYDEDYLINLNWQGESPLAGVNNDFSAKFQEIRNFKSGTYQFIVNADDGLRFLIDGKTVLDEWHYSEFNQYQFNYDFSDDPHNLEIQYFDQVGWAGLKIKMTQLSSNDTEIISHVSANQQNKQELFNDTTAYALPKFGAYSGIAKTGFVDVLKRYNDGWMLIKLSDDRTGWIAPNGVERQEKFGTSEFINPAFFTNGLGTSSNPLVKVIDESDQGWLQILEAGKVWVLKHGANYSDTLPLTVKWSEINFDYNYHGTLEITDLLVDGRAKIRSGLANGEIAPKGYLTVLKHPVLLYESPTYESDFMKNGLQSNSILRALAPENNGWKNIFTPYGLRWINDEDVERLNATRLITVDSFESEFGTQLVLPGNYDVLMRRNERTMILGKFHNFTLFPKIETMVADADIRFSSPESWLFSNEPRITIHAGDKYYVDNTYYNGPHYIVNGQEAKYETIFAKYHKVGLPATLSKLIFRSDFVSMKYLIDDANQKIWINTNTDKEDNQKAINDNDAPGEKRLKELLDSRVFDSMNINIDMDIDKKVAEALDHFSDNMALATKNITEGTNTILEVMSSSQKSINQANQGMSEMLNGVNQANKGMTAMIAGVNQANEGINGMIVGTNHANQALQDMLPELQNLNESLENFKKFHLDEINIGKINIGNINLGNLNFGKIDVSQIYQWQVGSIKISQGLAHSMKKMITGINSLMGQIPSSINWGLSRTARQLSLMSSVTNVYKTTFKIDWPDFMKPAPAGESLHDSLILKSIAELTPVIGQVMVASEMSQGKDIVTHEQIRGFDYAMDTVALAGGDYLKTPVKGAETIAKTGLATKFSYGAVKLDWLEKLGQSYTAYEVEGTVKVMGESKSINRRVYQLDDIDWNYVSPKEGSGFSNFELAQKGRSPYAKDDTVIQLHHLTQTEAGSMIELPASVHAKYYSELHGIIDDGESFRRDSSLSRQYENFRTNYWKDRVKNVVR